MDFSLLSINLLLILCGIISTIVVFLVRLILLPIYYPPVVIKRRGRPKKTEVAEELLVKRPHRIVKKHQTFWVLFIAIFLACSLRLLVAHYTDSAIPIGFICMLLPATITVGLVVFSFRLAPHVYLTAACCLLLSILFSLLLINNYYRFYPTIGEVFNQNGVTALNQKQSDVLVSHTAPTRGTTAANRQSIEGSLDAISNEPTKGKVYSLTIPGTVSSFHTRTAYVYLPAIYTTDPSIRLPVIILMPGFPGLPENWLGSGLQTTMDTFASAHGGITPIIFMVDNTGSVTNDTECVNSSRGNVETYLTVDVPNYIKSHFDVESGASHWAIGGLSLGGTCGIMLALRHPNIYDNFIDLGGEIGPEVGPEQQTIDTLFNGSMSNWQSHQPEYLLANNTYKGMGGFFGDGKQDTPDITQAATELNAEAQKAGIQTVYETINGEHTFNVWQETFKLALPWISNRLGATECRGKCL
jgi:S-formylglutathione hydrolase FrmB